MRLFRVRMEGALSKTPCYNAHSSPAARGASPRTGLFIPSLKAQHSPKVKVVPSKEPRPSGSQESWTLPQSPSPLPAAAHLHTARLLVAAHLVQQVSSATTIPPPPAPAQVRKHKPREAESHARGWTIIKELFNFSSIRLEITDWALTNARYFYWPRSRRQEATTSEFQVRVF